MYRTVFCFVLFFSTRLQDASSALAKRDYIGCCLNRVWGIPTGITLTHTSTATHLSATSNIFAKYL